MPLSSGISLRTGPSNELLGWEGGPSTFYLCSLWPRSSQMGPSQAEPKPPASLSSDYGPAHRQLIRGLGKKGFSLGVIFLPLSIVSLLLGYSSGPLSHPAPWDGLHGPVPAFDKRTESLLISPLKSHPMPGLVGLSAPPSLMPPNPGSILPVLNGSFLLTKNEVMLRNTGRCFSQEQSEWGGRRGGRGQKFGSRTHIACFGPPSP